MVPDIINGTVKYKNGFGIILCFVSPHIKVSCMPLMLSLITEELSCAFYLFFHISTFSGIAEELQIHLNGSEPNANTG